MVKILIVEDDPDTLDVTTYALRREGYEVQAAQDGKQGLERWRSESPDIVLVDAVLPRMDGFEVCRQIRDAARTPVIMLTARSAEEDKVRGLRLGADDYITKPFSPKELAARVQAVLRRTSTNTSVKAEVTLGDLALDIQTYEARKGSRIIHLTPLEFRIVYLLVLNTGRVMSYERLVQYAWGHDIGGAPLLKTHITHIRKKLRLPESGPGAIVSVAGVGYRILS